MKTFVGHRGFTLIEIMVALAILATGALILLNSHYASLVLFSQAQDEALMQGFIQRAVGLAEVDVLAGTLEGNGDFGSRNADYAYSFSAKLVDESQGLPLYHVTVTVTSPSGENKVEMFVYNMAQ